MSEKVVAVALLFDDAELGGHLRAALSEHGARIAHEGPVSSFDVSKLRQAGVDVLVVNLDESVDDTALDLVYELVAAGDIPVVFNDAQASRGLDGWDRARWARHLAAKTLNKDTIDPPRPEHAREVTPPVAMPVQAESEFPAEPVALAEPASEPELMHIAPVQPELPAEPATVAAAPTPEAGASPKQAALADLLQQPDEAPVRHEASDTLAAELEALLAGDDLTEPSSEGEFGSLKFKAEDELPPLHDGDFGWQDQTQVAPELHEQIPTSPGFAPAPAPVPAPASMEAPAFNISLDHLSLASVEEEFTPPVIEKATLAQQTPTPVAPEWGFVEEHDHAPAQAAGDKASLSVEKVSAADYLAPGVEFLEEESPVKPGMSLELVSMEDAIAPQDEYQPFESHLHELEVAFARLLVLGAARDSGASLADFLGALPGDLKLPILLTQHHTNDALEHMVASLATRCRLPVKVAAAGMRARTGEVVVVPRGQQVRITRDGHVELSAANDDVNGQSPSIDSSFTMAANVFGRGALAIVFAGEATDAVAGAQAIHDRGGQVWVEASASDHYADMVNGVMAERLASFSGSPQELAVRLVEDLR
ncbi:chemotaxis protein CheB [Dyella choica]|uniref:protein-glutamate methylesterase n=1 Tax=Dyella choica TaxID=1927959 RepID=A0A3S0RJK8_9GAMM|nr:chemotaxis protein CheB [Dyella choica]RUL73946.1 chemotaxis protein CheB [Dyella choica]